MGFLDFLQSVASGQTPSNPLAQRVAQQAVDAQHPTFMGRDVSGVPVLSGVIRPAVEALNTAGLIGEGAQKVAEATTGAGLAGLGLANRAGLLGMTRANQGELAQILGAGQGAGNPLAQAMAINQRAQSTVPGMGLVTAAVNPLNVVGPVGRAGAGLRALEDAPLALRALGTALEGASAVGRAGTLPYEGAFAALGGGLRKILPSAADAGAQFAAQNAGNTALTGAKGNVAYADLLKGLGENGKPGLGPEFPPLLGPAEPPELGPPAVFRGNVRQPDLVPGLGINGRPGLGPELPPMQGVPLPPEAGPALPTRGNVPGDQLLPGIGRNGGKGIGPSLPPEVGPPAPAIPAAIQSLGDLLGAARTTARPSPLDQLVGAGQRVAARDVPLPTRPETGQLPRPEAGPSTAVTPPAAAPPGLDFTDRAGTIRAVANAPVEHLNNVLRDLHNAVYPGQQADFAIPALTGQPRAAFRTSMLTDNPGGNAAEPYLDYMISRVQKDPKAAARLADLNPQLADDVSMVAENPLPLAEHKRLVQALFGVGPQGADVPTPVAAVPSPSAPPAAPAGTLDDVRNLILDHAQQFNTRYPPLDPQFYARRANVDPARVPAMLDQLVQEGTLGRLPDGSLAVRPGAGAALADTAHEITTPTPLSNVDIPAGPAASVADVAPATPNVAAPAAGSNEQRVVGMAALKGGTPTLGEIQREFKVGASEALRLQDVAAGRVAPTPTGGDLAAGGGELPPAVPVPDTAALKAEFDRLAAAFRAASPAQRPALMQPMKDAAAAYNAAREAEIGTAAFRKEGTDQMGTGIANALKPLKKAFGVAEDAAGGGGFGLVPLSTGRVVGGLSGTLVGGGVGFAAPAPDTETRMKRAATGALLGGTLGTGLGSTAQGEALAEEALAGNRAAWQAGSKDIRPTSIGNAVSVIRAPQKTALMTIPRNIMDNTIKQALGGKSPLAYLGDLLAQSREWGTLLPDLRNAGDEQQRMHLMLSSLGPDFANRDPESMARLAVKQGMDYNLDPEDLGTAGAHPLVSAGRGAIGALTQPTKLLATGFLTPAAGAAEGLTLAGRAALQSAALTPADMIGRFAFSMPDYTRQLADAAPAFIRKVAASGQSTALLDQEGRFGASLIKDPALRAEWEATQHAAEDAGAAVALDHMGDFGTHGAFRRIVNNAFPGGVWNIGQGQLLARRAAEHPQVALGAIRAAQESYRAALAAGHPEDAGTATIDDRTPGVGLLARLMNGGAAGVAHIPLTYSGSPIGPEILDVPRQLDPYLHPNQQLYDQIKTLTGALGLGANPALDMAAYRLGISDTPHAAASRWAPLGTYAEQVAHQAGVPGLGALTENPIADLLSPDAKPGDVKQQLRTNRYLDPAAITAGNEMIYELRGTSSSDPKNVDLVAQLRDPNSDFYRAALERGLGAKAGQALVNEVVPGHPQAQTATAYAAEAAKTALLNQGLPLTRAQFQEIAARPDGGVVLSQLRQAQIDAAKLANPVLAVQDVGTAKALGEKAFQQWERDNGGLAGFPLVYNILAQREQERLGLVPLGTAMAQQQAYDQLQAGQAYGRPQPYPGVQPLPYDPQPLYDLYKLFNGGR